MLIARPLISLRLSEIFEKLLRTVDAVGAEEKTAEDLEVTFYVSGTESLRELEEEKATAKDQRAVRGALGDQELAIESIHLL